MHRSLFSDDRTNKLIVELTSEQKRQKADLQRQRYYEKYLLTDEEVPDISQFQPLRFTVEERAIAWEVVRKRKLAQGIEYPVQQPASSNDVPYTPSETAFVERCFWAHAEYHFGNHGLRGNSDLLTSDMGKWFARCSQHTRNDCTLFAFHVHEVIGAYSNQCHPLTYRQLDARYHKAIELQADIDRIRRNKEQRAFKAEIYYEEHKDDISDSRAEWYQDNKHIKLRCDECGGQYSKTAWSNHKKSKTHRIAIGTYKKGSR